MDTLCGKYGYLYQISLQLIVFELFQSGRGGGLTDLLQCKKGPRNKCSIPKFVHFELISLVSSAIFLT